MRVVGQFEFRTFGSRAIQEEAALRITLRENWYTRQIDASFDTKLAGIYEWRIEGIGIYVGKARELHSRIGNYPNNVRRMMEGLPWHGDPTKKYRPIHHALRRAYDEGLEVSVVVLETCDSDPNTRKRLERVWIDRRRSEEQAGGPKVLNSN